MIVFFPFERPVNPFLNEIEKYFSGTFIFDHYSKLGNYDHIDLIHIHWPEVLFESKLPTKNQLNDFKQHFYVWKNKYKVVLTIHNIKPHVSKSELYKELYAIICTNVDAVFHFANHSIKIFKTLYPNNKAQHVVIPHPLYLETPNEISRKQARAFFNLKSKSKVVLVFGQIRTKKERQFLLGTFKHLKLKDKFLIVSTIGKFRPKFNLGFKFNNLFNKCMFKKFNSKSNYILKNDTVAQKDIQFYFNAADVILIPRLDSLNSGILYLALRFNNKVLAPNIGNIGEVSSLANQKVFDVKSLESVGDLLKNMLLDDKHTNSYTDVLSDMHPEKVANKHLEFYNRLINE